MSDPELNPGKTQEWNPKALAAKSLPALKRLAATEHWRKHGGGEMAAAYMRGTAKPGPFIALYVSVCAAVVALSRGRGDAEAAKKVEETLELLHGMKREDLADAEYAGKMDEALSKLLADVEAGTAERDAKAKAGEGERT